MFNAEAVIIAAGYFGLFGIVFAESGLLIGFFLPGDSLLFTAGILASNGYLNIYWLCTVLFVAAVLGDNVGYAFGKKVGPKIFKREDSLFFHKDNILKAKVFFDRHGGKTIILARFIPIVRTFAPVVAGVGHMHYRRFVAFNLIGALVWAVGLTVLGYTAGKFVPGIEKYVVPIALGIIFLSILPGAVKVLRDAEQRKIIHHKIRRMIGRD